MITVSEIFSTPIYQYENVKDITEKELYFVENEIDRFRNVGNETSLNNYILDRQEFKELKTF